MRFLVFGVTATALFAAVHVYLYRRLVRDVTQHRALRGLGIGVFTLGPLAFVVGRWLARAFPDTFGGDVGLVALMWIGLVIYLFLTTAVFSGAAHLGLFVRRRVSKAPPAPELDPARRQFLSRAVAGGALLSSASLVGYGSFRAFTPATVTEISLKLKNLPRALDGFTIAQLSDVHVGGIINKKFLDERVRQVDALKPDLVAITGDLVDSSVDHIGGTVAAAVANLKSRYGTFFCTGNHDFYAGADEWCAAIAKMGVRVLRNERLTIGDAGGSFDLVGVDDWGHRDDGGYDLDRALAGYDLSRASVLLAHQPSSFEAAARRGIGLQLSGHTHGGQLFPGTLFAELIWSFSAGHYTVGDAHIYVSRGTGFVGPPVRVGSPAEIVKVVLTA